MDWGGCLIVNDDSFTDRAEIIWERGTDRSAFFKGLVDKYSWREVGSSFYPSELQSAFLIAQLESMGKNLSYRRKVWDSYAERLGELESTGWLRIIRPPGQIEHNAHMFAIQLESSSEADRVRKGLNDAGIGAVIHYVPLHTSRIGKNLGYSESDLPITVDSASRLLRLPLHHQVSEAEINYVVSSLNDLR